MLRQLESAALRLGHLRQRLKQQHPARRLEQHAQRIDELEQRLHNGWQLTLRHHRQRLEHLHIRLRQQAPLIRLQHFTQQYDALRQRLEGAMQHRLERENQRLQGLAGRLHAYSPLATLERGYALPLSEEGRLVHSVHDTRTGDVLALRLRDGWLDCRVESIRPED